MSYRRPHRNVYALNRVRSECGLSEYKQRGSWSSTPEYVGNFTYWNDKARPKTALYDRVLRAFLLTKDIELSVVIGRRTASNQEAIEQARAAKVLMEASHAG